MEHVPLYSVYRSNRKTVRITVRLNGTIAVYCPKRCSEKYLDELVLKHYEALMENYNRNAPKLNKITNGQDSLPLLGKYYPIIRMEIPKPAFDEICFYIPRSFSDNQVRIWYQTLLRNKAKDLILPKVSYFAEKHSFKYNKARIKAMYSRWGSCSAKSNLNFSLALVACDERFIDYVILHELCHTVHMNHSKCFYTLLNSVCPDHKSIYDSKNREYSLIMKAINCQAPL